MKKRFIKAVSVLAAAGILLGAAGCGKQATTVGSDESKSGITEKDLTRFMDLELGKDYTDLQATITVLNGRNDLVDTLFAEYNKRFNEMYPGIKVNYDTPTDYAEDMTLRLTTKDWGDVCMIPTTVDKDEYPRMFLPFGTINDMSKRYILMDNRAYGDDVYGIPAMCNVQGIVYNKHVFEKAGITELPKTPDEFLDALQKIKDNTNAVPLYSNFSSGWAMGAWDGYIGGSATGDPDFTNKELVHGSNPFADRGDMTGPYAVYYTLYEVFKRGLTEEDPTTSDWEGSKGMINRGEIGCMVLGSWAVQQFKEAGNDPDAIGYMPFPITVKGKQYASAAPDYAYGINLNASIDNKMASLIYVKWMIEESGYAESQDCISIIDGAPEPEVLKDFDGVELIVDSPAPAGEETLLTDINNESELGINSDNYPDCQIAEAALTKSQTLNEIMDTWNKKWTAAQEKFGAR